MQCKVVDSAEPGNGARQRGSEAPMARRGDQGWEQQGDRREKGLGRHAVSSYAANLDTDYDRIKCSSEI